MPELSLDPVANPSKPEGPSINRRIFRAAVIVTFAGVLVKMVATLKEFVVAGAFGRSDAMDAFLIAFMVPGLLVNLFSESMNQALIPTLVRVREQEGPAKAQELLSSAMIWTCMLLTGGSLAMALVARFFFPMVVPHFSPAKLLLTEAMFYALLPVVLIAGIASNCTAVLNTFDRFAWPALAPMVTPLTLMLGAWMLAPHIGIWSLVYANLAGALVHALLMVWMMQTHGYRFKLRWHGASAAAREVAGQYGPILLSGLVASSGMLVDQSMAASLNSGSVATLAYANRFVGVILNLLAGAIATAVTPYFSQLVARRDWAGCRHTMNTYAVVTALVSVPVTLVMIVGAHWMVRLLFQHGVFGPRDTSAVTPVLAMYAIQLPFYVVSRVFYRYLVAIRRTSLILYCGILNLVLDVILNLILMRWFGVAGIALATSLWTVSAFLFLWFWAYRLLPRAESQRGMSARPAQYLLRFDDLCPTMDRARWQRFLPLIQRFGLYPILAVVPENCDPELKLAPPDSDFWGEMRQLAAAGASIGLHGYRHVCDRDGRSLIPLHSRTEFAGVDEATQREWIRSGIARLTDEGLPPRIWVAPRHGFDRTTLRVLQGEGLEAVSDGFAEAPFSAHGAKWIPQQLWEPIEKQSGLWTICLHPNSITDDGVLRWRSFWSDSRRSLHPWTECSPNGLFLRAQQRIGSFTRVCCFASAGLVFGGDWVSPKPSEMVWDAIATALRRGAPIVRPPRRVRSAVRRICVRKRP